jgi:hypothetical protein
MNKVMTVVTAALTVTMALLAAPVFSQDAKQARIQFVKLEHDFGTMRGTTHQKHEFKFQNTGDAELVITAVESSCGCTAAAPDKKNFAPGESGVISASVDPTRVTGSFAKGITVRTNDPNSPHIVLTVKGNSIRDVSWSPSNHVVFGNIASTAAATRTVELNFGADEPIRVLEATSESPNVRASVKELVEGKKYMIELTTVPPLPFGAFGRRISVKTDHEQYKMLECIVQAVVVAPITAYPPEAVVQEEDGYLIAPAIVVRHNSGGKFQITGTEVEPKGFQLRVSPLPDGNAYRVLLTSPPPNWEAKGAGVIIVHTDDKDVPEIRVPLRFKQEK